MKRVLLFISMFLFCLLEVDADKCNSKEVKRLTELAGRVKINYEVVKTPLSNDKGESSIAQTFEITIYNVTEDIYVIMTNDYDDEEIVVLYSDTKDGKYTFKTNNISSVIKYDLNIYARSEECNYRKLRNIKFTKPRRNPNYYLLVCKDNWDIPICSEFTTDTSATNTLELKEYIENYKKGKITTTTTKVKDDMTGSLSDYKIYIIVGGLVIVIGATIIVVVKKKRGNI